MLYCQYYSSIVIHVVKAMYTKLKCDLRSSVRGNAGNHIKTNPLNAFTRHEYVCSNLHAQMFPSSLSYSLISVYKYDG